MSADPIEQRTPEEPRALVAVDHSARLYARAFPYLQWRFGEFGEGFVRSDNAHLIALAEHDPGELERQIRWTAELLSERGMPGWMLEVDLRFMARSVARILPDRPDMCEQLERSAAELAKYRHGVMKEIGFRRCAAGFASHIGRPEARVFAGMGCILAAAAADERRGIAHAVERVHEWAADRRRFGPRWVEAVDRTVAHARRLT